MTPLPRGVCSVCGRTVPVRVNGTAREHVPAGYPQASDIRVCEGSGKPVKEDEAGPGARARRRRAEEQS